MLKSLLSSIWEKIINSGLSYQLLRISYLVGLITLTYKFLFVIRDLIVAWTFGRSQPLEAFLLAFLIPFSFTNAISNSLTMTFVPHFIELREDGEIDRANEVYSGLLGILLVSSIFMVLLLILGYSLYAPIVAASFSIEGFSLMKFLVYFTAPAAVLTGVANLWKEILNAKGRFLQSSSVSTITPMISILLLNYFTDLGVWVLALGLLIGIILELIILAILLKIRNFKLLPGLNILSLNLKIPLNDWWKGFISLSLFNSMTLISSSMAARRSEIGGLSMLNYGRKIVTLPNDISAITYSAVLIPYLSKLSASKDWPAVMRVLNRWLIVIFATTLPIVVFMIFSADYIVQVLYERGAFTSDDSRNVSTILVYYVFQLPFFVSFFVMLRVLPVIKENTSTLSFGAIGVALTVFFNYIFISFLGTQGIALATSCVYFCLSVGLYGYIRGMLFSKS